MEWLIGLFVIWFLSLFDNSQSNKNKSDDLNEKFKSNNDAGALNRLENERLERAQRQARLDESNRVLKELEKERLEKIRLLQIQIQKEVQEDPVDKKLIEINQDAIVGVSIASKNSSVKVTQSTSKSKSVIVSHFNFFGINSLWHITHQDNIKSILDNGIFSNRQAFEIARPRDISNHDVQKWRDRVEPINKRIVHEYAPMYINVRNPMLYVKKNLNSELCIIEVSLSVLEDGDFVFTDGNAASRDTKFYKDIKDLSFLPWDVLNASYWNDFQDGKRKRCSEVLIYPHIDVKHILKVHCYSEQTLHCLSGYKCDSMISKQMFF